ncbi:MAG: DegT/DnrJ/EryC1/StrS family aminotransferase [Candidatus Krumholzibacteriota bacterium]|nr:DegT/DnrJ/EryC1/StrS family aminotransferase [Candidatus Krumholzibacteriota bacterium]
MTGERSRVKLLDPARQFEPFIERLEQTAAKVIRSGWYLLGKETESFEKRFAGWLGVDDSVSCANGTDAIALALGSAGIGKGDRVITVPNTAFPTACGISMTGAEPLFADIDRDTWLIDIEKTAGLVDDSVRAVIPVHLYGHVVDIEALRKALPDDMIIIEDCAQAHGALLGERKVGTIGDIGAFSFYPSKNLCALGDAGAVVSADTQYLKKARELRFYGQERRDHHTSIGRNSRIDEIQAAFLSVEMEYIDRWISRRREIAAIYDSQLDREVFRRPIETPGTRPSYHLYVIRVDDRERFRKILDEDGIDTGVHYPVPVPFQPAYSGLGTVPGDLPNAESLASGIVSLPVAPHLDQNEVERVIESCRRYAGSKG